MLQSKRKQKIESGSEKLLFSKLDAFFGEIWFFIHCLMKNYSFACHKFIICWIPFQNSNGIVFLINKSNAEYYHNTILVSNCNDSLSFCNMCLHLFVVIPLSLKRYFRLKINYIMKLFQKLNRTSITLLEN